MKGTNTITIFPLSPDSSLSNDKRTKVYFGLLDDALSKPKAKRIHNIAISGGFGTGKSSLIRSYDRYTHESNHKKTDDSNQKDKAEESAPFRFLDCKKHERKKNQKNNQGQKKEKTKYLYVSIGEYASNMETNCGTDVNRIKSTGRKKGSSAINAAVEKNDAKEQPEELTAINAVERRMLLQIFARFRKADLPQSSFRLFPEEWLTHHWWITPFAGLFMLGILLLSFHDPLGKLLVAVGNMDVWSNLAAQIIDSLVKYKTLIRFILTSYCIAFIAIVIMLFCMRFLPRIRFRAFMLKGANAELSVEQETAESYLDLYSTELVYCLEKLARKIDHVVVFEDLDRLDNDACLHIMTRLREINNLVNLRLQQTNRHLCFIYAINDGFLESIQHEKFFDYIIPIIPEMNKRSAAKLFADKIKEIDKSFNATVEFPHFDTVISCLSDYRLQNTILNEYQVLQRLYRSVHNCSDDEPKSSVKNEMLAFSIYKNCWPGDYHALREGNSQIFTRDGVKCPQRLKRAKYGILLQLLTDPDNHLLTQHSVYYVGFDEKALVDFYSAHWEAAINNPTRHKEIITELDTIQECETECLAAVQEFFGNRDHLKKEITGKESEYYVDVFRAVVKCMVRCRQENNSWFFISSHYNSCIKLLAKMDGDGDEAIKREFFVLSFPAIENQGNFYGATNTALKWLSPYSLAEFIELCRGLKKIPLNAGITLRDMTNDATLAEVECRVRKVFSQSQTTPYFD